MSVIPVKGQNIQGAKPGSLAVKPASPAKINKKSVHTPDKAKEWEYFCRQAEIASCITGQSFTEADITASADGSVYVFGNNKPVTVNAGTRLTFCNGIITVYASKFKYGNDEIECLNAPISICNNRISGAKFRLNNIQAEGAEGKEGYIIINKDKYTIGTSTVVETAGTRISERLGGVIEIDLYFDGKEHSGDYVSIDLQNRRITINSDHSWVNNDEDRLMMDEAACGPKVEFLKDNVFVRIEENDLFTLSASGTTRLDISNRDKDNLIPEIKITGDAKDNDIVLANGDMELRIKNSEVSYPDYTSRMNKATTPIAIKLLNKNGKDLIGTKNEPKIILFSNYNECFVLPSRSTTGFVVPVAAYAKVPASVSAKLDFNYHNMRDIFSKRFPKIKLKGEFKDADLKKLLDILNWVAPALLAPLTEINMAPKGQGIARAFRGHAANVMSGGYFEGGIPIEASLRVEEEFPYMIGVFTHELAHSLTALYDMFDSILANPHLLDPYKNINPALYREMVNYGKKGSFGKRWLEAAGGETIYDRLWQNIQHPRNVSWTDGTGGPREGVVSAYGSTTHEDDIAEFVGKTYHDPESIIPLVDPKSPSYDVRYVKKINLLREYGFILEEKYNIIFKNK